MPEMLNSLDESFTQIEKKLLAVKKKYQQLQEQFAELSEDYEQMQLKYEAERKKNQELAEEQKTIKIRSAIAGNPDHNRLMKNHINRLVKEVDACIAQLQNSGL